MTKIEGVHRAFASVCSALLLLTGTVCYAAWPTPDDCDDGLVLTSCGTGDATFLSCFQHALQHDMLLLKDGNKNLELDSIDPLFVKEMSLKLPLQQTIHLSSLIVTGLSNLNVTSLSEKAASTLEFSFYIPRLKIRSSYVLNGPWSITESRGTSTITIRDYRTSFALDFVVYEDDDGSRHIQYTRSRSKFIDAGSTQVQLKSFSGATIDLDLTSNEVRSAFEASIARKQAEINYAYTVRLYQYFPPSNVWFNPNATGPYEICAHPHHRDSVTCSDICGRGF